MTEEHNIIRIRAKSLPAFRQLAETLRQYHDELDLLAPESMDAEDIDVLRDQMQTVLLSVANTLEGFCDIYEPSENTRH